MSVGLNANFPNTGIDIQNSSIPIVIICRWTGIKIANASLPVVVTCR